jgi:hypothetical protein
MEVIEIYRLKYKKLSHKISLKLHPSTTGNEMMNGTHLE